MAYDNSYDVREQLRRLEEELNENQKQENKLQSAMNGIKRQLKEIQEERKVLHEEINDIQSRMEIQPRRKLQAKLSELEDELDESWKQEGRRVRALLGKKEELKEIKEEREELLEEIAELELDVQPKFEVQSQPKDLQRELSIVLQGIGLANQDKCNTVLQTLLPLVIERMQDTNRLFERMYKCIVYTGSYYEKLRIKDAGEFDINLVLDLPVDRESITVIPQNPPSYALLCLEGSVDDLDLDEIEARDFDQFLDDQLYFLPGELLNWFGQIVSKARLNELAIEGVKQITYTSEGPAKTLKVKLDDLEQTTISIDLVVVFRFPYEYWPKEVQELRQPFIDQIAMENRNLYLVPKCYKYGAKQTPHEPARVDMPRIWRMNFPDVEKSILKNYSETRSVIKLLKLLRDSEKWNNLHSCFLKTLVLNDIADDPDKDWSQSLLAERLLEMMEKLKQCLDRKMLPNFFFDTVNVFQYMKATEMDSISNRLDKIMEIREDSSLVQAYFKF